jgi:hypothetical protein
MDKLEDSKQNGERFMFTFTQPLLPESVKTNKTFQEDDDTIINSVGRQTKIENKEPGKVFMLNYFDTNTGGYKKILVEKIN